MPEEEVFLGTIGEEVAADVFEEAGEVDTIECGEDGCVKDGDDETFAEMVGEATGEETADFFADAGRIIDAGFETED
jgi:hypothetical protein